MNILNSNNMRPFFIYILSLQCLFIYAQQGTLKSNIDTKNFPKVSFIWNEYTPNILHPNQFALKENGKELAFSCGNIPVDSIPQKNKTILFLWEDQPVRQEQFYFTGALLFYFFKEDMVNDEMTTFNIAVFNRKQGDEPVLKSKLPEFTPDKGALQDYTRGYEHDYTRFQNPYESDFILALREGLDLIGKEPKDNIRAIVVVTAGLSVRGEMLPVINQSLQNKIPIYVIHYPTSKNKSESALRQLAEETYGQLILSNGNPETTREELLKCFNELNRRHYGQDYKISFTSLLKRDGKPYSLTLTSNGTEHKIEPYKTPDFSLAFWMGQHLILFLILLVISILAITLGIIFGIKFFKKRKEGITAQKQAETGEKVRESEEREAIKRKQAEIDAKIERQRREAEKLEKERLAQEQEEQLTKLMRVKNFSPRLIVVNDSVTFNINKATTTIGRLEDNDIVFSDLKVSKYHAKILFNGSCFEIHDLSSTNGTFVNSYRIESTELKRSDIIQLGDEVIIKFYL